jgi:hypothetical protein
LAASGARGGGADSTGEAKVGYFSDRYTTAYAGSAIVFELWITTGGSHLTMSSRQDFNPTGQVWSFLSSFRKDPTGKLTRVTPTWISGTY